MPIKTLATILLICMTAATAKAGGKAVADSAARHDIQQKDTVKTKTSLIKRVINYFNESNKVKEDDKPDFSIIGGPHYDTDSELGIGIMAAGRYRCSRQDTLTPLSNSTIIADFTTAGFYSLGLRGINIFKRDKCRIEYDIKASRITNNFWGAGYTNCNNDGNESEMKRWQINAKASLMWQVANKFYIGPQIVYDYVDATSMERPELLGGDDRMASNLGGGLVMVYDTRDIITNPHKGVYLNASYCYRPDLFGDGHDINSVSLRFDAYKKAWKGGVIAIDFCSEMNFGNPSWGMMATLGGSRSMRGYYEGRYRDKHKIEAQVELRQHVWRRNGVVAWVGAGTVFDKFGNIQADKILPNFGLGYRWEFKKDINLRCDYGFGKSGQNGFMFSINEAF